jgi:predicted dehydrogenase
MSKTAQQSSSRRDFLKNTGRIAAAATLAQVVVPRVHAAENNTLQVALIGCGGRGTGAAADAMSVTQGPVKLVAVADVFEDRVRNTVNSLEPRFADHMDVPPERQFVGFDAYKHAMDCLRPGDIAIFASPPVFRWVHFDYAVKKGLNAFMEKPLTADAPTSRRLLDLGRQATAKNLKVGVGLMSRHARHLQQLHQRISDGEIGEIVTMFAYRMHGPLGFFASDKWPGNPSELLWQIQRFHSFIWASGGCFSDFYIHVIDHCCWMKNAWPVKAQALGGRHYRLSPEGNRSVDQNFDTYSVEYTFADGAKLIANGRCMVGAEQIYRSQALGTKGMAVVSRSGDCGPPSSTHRGLTTESDLIWRSEVPPDQQNPYLNEWNDLVDAIRADEPFNEVEHGVQASLVCSLGRKAAHTGIEITYEEMLNDDLEYAPGADQYTTDSPAPLQANAEGEYPVPQPGLVTDREY